MVARGAYESEASGLDSANRTSRGETCGLPRRCSSKRILVEPDIFENRVHCGDVGAVMNALDLRGFGLLSMNETREAVQESLESVRALRVGVMTG